MVDAKDLAIKFHETYEGLAPSYGYETRKETKDFDPNTDNGRLMIATCQEIINWWEGVSLLVVQIDEKSQ